MWVVSDVIPDENAQRHAVSAGYKLECSPNLKGKKLDRR